MTNRYSTIRYRLIGDKKLYLFFNQLAGTNRHLWNKCPADLENQYKPTSETQHSFFDLCKWYVKQKQEVAWFKKHPQVLTITILQDLSHAIIKPFYKASSLILCSRLNIRLKNRLLWN